MVDGISGARPLVLVAEDDALTRMAAVAMLREAGYDTVEATSGPQAMLVLEETPGVRVLLTDIVMPAGIDGITLAACVHRRWPDIAIVMTSGQVTPVPGDVPGGALFFAKPYAADVVLAGVRGLVAGQDRGRSAPPVDGRPAMRF